jgi:hypothetical protein
VTDLVAFIYLNATLNISNDDTINYMNVSQNSFFTGFIIKIQLI